MQGLVDQLQPERTALVVALHNNGVGHCTIDSYMNVEARHGHRVEQGQMLRALLARATRITAG